MLQLFLARDTAVAVQLFPLAVVMCLLSKKADIH